MRRFTVTFVLGPNSNGNSFCVVVGRKSSRRATRVRAKKIARELTPGRFVLGTYHTSKTVYVFPETRAEVIR
jgi:hypothetical protein